MTDEEFYALAAEYMLGLLEGEALTQAETLRVQDARFRAAIARWEAQLLPFVEELEPVAPPPEAWARIAAATQPVAPALARSAARRFAWPAAGLLAALAAVLVLVLRDGTAPQARQIATLQTPGGGAFTVTQTATQLLIAPHNITLPPAKTAELWLLVAGAPPRPFGLLDATHTLSEPVPQTPGGFVLAVSLEPPGGSPTGLPSGPVIAKAAITKL